MVWAVPTMDFYAEDAVDERNMLGLFMRARAYPSVLFFYLFWFSVLRVGSLGIPNGPCLWMICLLDFEYNLDCRG
jgi:hypothetical protein